MNVFNLLLLIFTSFSIAFALKQLDGPWNIILKFRSILMRLPYAGPFFYKMLDCYYCVSWHLGWFLAWTVFHITNIFFLVMYAFTVSIASLLLNQVMIALSRDHHE